MKSSRIFIEDMVYYAGRAVEFVGDRSGRDLEAEEMRYLAVQRCISLVGEAAGRVSKPVRDAFADIAFSQAAGIRHVIVHGYRVLESEIIVKTVKAHFPSLIAALEAALARPLPDEAP